jgi:cytochrome c
MKTVRTGLVAAALIVAGPALAQNPEDLLKSSGCTACHLNDKKLVGPAYRDVANKYRGEKGIEVKLVEKVKKGGSGVWGPVPMPANALVKDADINTMVKYILSLK